MIKSFVNNDRPIIIGMLKSITMSDLLNEIKLVLSQGVDAFGFQIDRLVPQERNAKNYKILFAAMQGKPAYVTNYIRGNALELDDEELTRELLLAVECGAKLVDIRCDLFDRQPCEYTTDKKAIQKQMKVIRKIKDMGAEVLMSAHVLKYIPCEEVLEIAYSQQARGVDVVKIVIDVNSEEELRDALKTSVILKEKLDVASLFLCNGTHCEIHRMIGPLLGTDLFLTVENSTTGQTQPTIQRAREQLALGGYTNLP